MWAKLTTCDEPSSIRIWREVSSPFCADRDMAVAKSMAAKVIFFILLNVCYDVEQIVLFGTNWAKAVPLWLDFRRIVARIVCIW